MRLKYIFQGQKHSFYVKSHWEPPVQPSATFEHNLEEMYSAANDPRPQINDPQIGLQMIPNRKWSPVWTTNDPHRKISNGMDFGFLDF